MKEARYRGPRSSLGGRLQGERRGSKGAENRGLRSRCRCPRFEPPGARFCAGPIRAVGPRGTMSCGGGREVDDEACCSARGLRTPGDTTDCSESGLSFHSVSGDDSVTEAQGYEADFEPPLESKYECPICLMALREPVQTPCGHRFCRACILHSMRDAGPKCPVDNAVLHEGQLFPDNFAKREILSLTVRCPNKPCGHRGELRALQEHQLRCEYAQVPCVRCEMPVCRRDLAKHEEQECMRRIVTCLHCCEKMAYQDSKNHEQMCPLVVVNCKHCQQELIREQLGPHLEVDCQQAQVPCTFSPLGCEAQMVRSLLAAHMHEHTQVHMRLLANGLKILRIQVGQGAQPSSAAGSSAPPNSLSWLSSTSGGDVQTAGASRSQGLRDRAACDCAQELDRLREITRTLEERVILQLHQIRELSAKTDNQQGLLAEATRLVRSLEARVAESESRLCAGIFTWRVERFSRLLPGGLASGFASDGMHPDAPAVMHSSGFYTGVPGYRLCLRLQVLSGREVPAGAASPGVLLAGRQPHLALFVHLLQGDYDHRLPWPFNGRIRISVVDQCERDSVHVTEMMDADPQLSAFQRPSVHRNPKGFGYMNFMDINTLHHRSYLRDDCLVVRCEVMTTLGPGGLQQQGLLLEDPPRPPNQPENVPHSMG
ncbi:TNF receptor-associated factor 6 isoform X1 [Lampetra fluviatilis]